MLGVNWLYQVEFLFPFVFLINLQQVSTFYIHHNKSYRLIALNGIVLYGFHKEHCIGGLGC